MAVTFFTKRHLGPRSGLQGLTVVEVLMALAVGSLVLAAVFKTFISQSDAYNRQVAVSALQQNLRAAMTIVCNDIRTAGGHTVLGRTVYPEFVDWHPHFPGRDDLYPVIHGIDNVTDTDGYADGSDVLLIVRAGDDRGVLAMGETASLGEQRIFIASTDLDGDGDSDLNATGKCLGMLMSPDLARSHLFRIRQCTPGTLMVAAPLPTTFIGGDLIARVDIVVYRVDRQNATFARPVLERKNMGRGNRFQVVAEDIVDLQCSYLLADDTQVDDPAGQESLVRAVSIVLTAEAPGPGRSVVRRQLESEVFIRNASVWGG
jgi:hypothetical protein